MKKLNKFVAVLVALAMMAALAVTSAFAANPQGNATNVIITKKLNLAKGLTTPGNTEFNFTVSPKSYDEDTSDAAKEKCPTITVGNIEMKSETADDGAIYKTVEFNLDSVYFTDTKTADGKIVAGVYKYEIAEVTPASTDSTYVPGMTYDTAKYLLTVAVKADGTKTVTIKQTNEDGAKVNGSKTEKVPGQQDTEVASDVIFENTYTKDADGTDTGKPENDPAKYASFLLTKNVDKDYGDKDYEWTFDLTLSETPDKVLKLNADSTTKEEVTSLTGIKLKHGEKLAVYGVPVGTTYTVTEKLDKSNDTEKKYVATVTVIENGEQTDKTVTYQTNDDAKTKEGESLAVTNALIGEKSNSAAYVNTNQKAKDEDPGDNGILISNLPYIVLALVAVGGLCAYVVVRRKADDEA